MSNSNSILSFLFFILLSFSSALSFGQELTIIDNGANSLGKVDVLNCSVQLEVGFGEIPPIGFIKRDFTYSKDGKLLFLVNENTINNGLHDYCFHALDPDWQDVNQIGCFQSVNASHLTTAPDGTIYLGGYYLEHFDPATGQSSNLGYVGFNGQAFIYISALVFFQGNLYAHGYDVFGWPNVYTLVKVNLEDPLNSTLLFSLSYLEQSDFGDMEVVNLGCDSSFVYGVRGFVNPLRDSVYRIDVNNLIITALCELDYRTKIASPSAHLHFDCVPTLDLDLGFSGLDHHASSVCVAIGDTIHPFSSALPTILTNTIVDSVWVGLIGGVMNVSDESIACDGGLNYSPSNGGLMLKNNLKLANEEFMDLLQLSVRYTNLAATLTEGIRELAIVPFHKDYAGDTARLWLPILVSPNAGVSTAVQICQNDSPVLLYELLNGQPELGGSWTFGANSANEIFDPMTNLSGEYIYTLPGGSCPDVTASVTLNIQPLPIFSLGPDGFICSDDLVFLGPNQLYPNAFYQWQDGSISQTIEVNEAGEYWLEISDSLGCLWRDTLVLTDASTVMTDSLIFLCEDDSVSFAGDWYKDETVDCSVFSSVQGCDSTFCLLVEMLPSYSQEIMGNLDNGPYSFNGKTYSEPGNFVVNLTTIDGCDSTFTLLLSESVAPMSSGKIFIPNAFSPNGDGVNDVFAVYASPDVLILELMVFDRRGSLLFQGKGADAWDGKAHGKELPMDAYTYLLRALLPNGQEKIEHGIVNLLR